ncbi:MAG: type II toxin-antitoxin system VapC family toxin [Azospirillaceae bacterium]|nr:type II toxin-antitoxin system VapC family toxin [Azospirillaceae bacterium]
MSEGAVVLDASAVLALVWAEPGANVVMGELPGALITSVNFAEVLTKLSDKGWQVDAAAEAILSLGVIPVDFSNDHAMLAAQMRHVTKSAGLSLGDRACLSLGQQLRAKVLTADLAWLKVRDALGIDVVAIRQPRS